MGICAPLNPKQHLLAGPPGEREEETFSCNKKERKKGIGWHRVGAILKGDGGPVLPALSSVSFSFPIVARNRSLGRSLHFCRRLGTSGGAETEARPRLGAFFLLACTSPNISRPFFQSKRAVPLILQPFSRRPQWRQTPAPVRLQSLQSTGAELEPPGQVQPVPWSRPNAPLSRTAQ